MDIVVLFEVNGVERSFVVDDEIGDRWMEPHMDKFDRECEERKTRFL